MSLTKEEVSLTGFEIFCHSAQIKKDLKNYQSFYSDVETLFEKKDSELQLVIDKKLEDVPEEYHSGFIAGHSQDLHENQFLFPSMHRESIFITLFNYLEHSLNEYCRLIAKLSKSEVKLKDLSHKGVQRAIIYLEKIALLDLSSANVQREFISNSNTVRNRIVHAGGVLPDSKNEKVNKFVESHSHLAGSVGYRVIFRSEFIPEFINTLLTFFNVIRAESLKYVKKYT